MDKNDFPFEEIIPEACIRKDLHVSPTCKATSRPESWKEYFDSFPEGTIWDLKPRHIAKPAFSNANEWIRFSDKDDS